MRRRPVRNPCWSRAFRKAGEDWDASQTCSQVQRREQTETVCTDWEAKSEDIRKMEHIRWSTQHSEHRELTDSEACSCGSSTSTTVDMDLGSTSKFMAPKPDIIENNCKRAKSDKYEEDPEEPLTEPCFKSAADVGRKWNYTRIKDFHRHGKKSFPFSVISYNILSDDLLHMHPMLYDDCSTVCLDWEYRKKNLLRELLHYNADVLCLQEVEEQHYRDWFEPELRQAGYHSIYKKRTREKTDGCATFYKHSRFSLLTHRKISYRMEGVPLLDRDNIATLAVLQPRFKDGTICSDTSLCVANTHLLFNKNRGEIKLLQLACLFAEIDKLRNEFTRDRKAARGSIPSIKHCPVILCGDFNMKPYFPLYGLAVRGYLDYKNKNKKELSGQNPPLWKHNDRDMLRSNVIPRELNLMPNCTWTVGAVGCSDTYSEEQTRRQANNILRNDEQGVAMSRKGQEHGKPWSDSVDQNCRASNATSSSHVQHSSTDRWSSERDSHPSRVHETLSSCRNAQSSCSSDSQGSSRDFEATSGTSSKECSKNPPVTSPEDQNPSYHASCTTIQHGLHFWSAYTHFFPSGVPEVTTYHEKEPSCTVDYIFTSSGPGRSCRHCRQWHSVIELRGSLGLLSEEQLALLGGLPNRKLSSDHVALQASFFLHL